MESIKGYKTYFLAVMVILATVAKVLGFIDDSMYQTLVAILGAGAVSTLRASVSGIDKKLLIPIFLLLVPTFASAQTVTTGPVDTSMKFAWELPTNLSLTDAPTLEFRMRDTLFPTVTTVLTAVQCNVPVAGGPVSCISQLTSAIVSSLNKIGVHSVTLTYFRSDVGESSQSLPFGLPIPLTAPMNFKITK